MVMRSGKRMVCLKMRRSDDEGTQYVTYADTSNEWDVAPAIPSKNGGAQGVGVGAGAGAAGAGASANGSNGMRVDENGGVYVPNGAAGSLGAVSAQDIDCSGMAQLSVSDNAQVKDYSSQHRYGSGFEGQTSDSLSIELGTDSNVNNLETLWHDLSGRYSSLLSNYEPFYSVDAPADGQGKELFHLRIGPVKSLDNGDAVCSQLGRNGVFCSVVRVQ